MKCNQICPYNTLKGCVVMDRNGVCPLSITELLGMSEQLVRTNDVLIRMPKKEKCKNYTKRKSYGYCSGVKEFDMCFCNGDKSKCDFYEEIKKDNSPQKYEVVIADDNIFVICPVVYDEKEKSDIVKYDKSEIYANQSSINTLKDLRFEKCKY